MGIIEALTISSATVFIFTYLRYGEEIWIGHVQ